MFRNTISVLYEGVLAKFPEIGFMAGYEVGTGMDIHANNTDSIEVEELDLFCSSFLDVVDSESQDIIVEYAETGSVSFYKISEGLWLIVFASKEIFPRLNLEIKKIREVQSRNQKKTLFEKNSTTNSKLEKEKLNKTKAAQEKALPDFSLLNSYFERHFLYYSPRDLIGGDLYWIKETDRFLFIVLSDCTGHGIEGAKRTIALSELLEKQNYSMDTRSILLDIHDAISQNTKTPKKDTMGFEIQPSTVICKYNKAAGRISLATTGVPVLHIELKGEFHLIKTKGLQHSKLQEVKIESIDLNVNKGDRLVFYTDGLSNQFDASNKKKLNNKGVRNMFSKLNGNFSLEGFSEMFSEWKGKNNQQDDISVIGLEF